MNDFEKKDVLPYMKVEALTENDEYIEVRANIRVEAVHKSGIKVRFYVVVFYTATKEFFESQPEELNDILAEELALRLNEKKEEFESIEVQKEI